VEPQRRRILDAASIVFGRYGYRRASIGLVAEETGLSRQALYRYFESKEALFAAAVEDLHRAALEASDAAAAAASAAGSDSAALLCAQLDARFGYILGRLHGSVHAAEMLEESSRQCGAISAEHGRRLEASLARTIAAEHAAGRLPLSGDVSAAELVECLIAAARGIKSAVPLPSPEQFRRDLHRMVRLLVAGAAGTPVRADESAPAARDARRHRSAKPTAATPRRRFGNRTPKRRMQ